LGYEEKIMTIIVKSGEAKSCCMRAIGKARKGEYTDAEALIAEAEQCLREAHGIQTELLSGEADGKKHEVTMLMIHAQDHLMNTMTVKDLGSEIIAILKERQ